MTEQQPYDVVTRYPRFEVRRYPPHLVAVVESRKIAMTAPVIQEPSVSSGRHLVSFVMPAEYSLDTLPAPTDPRIAIHEVAAEVAAAMTFTGRWTENLYQDHLAELRKAVVEAGLEISGPPRFARFDPPWKPWFLRRNEVLLPVLFVV